MPEAVRDLRRAYEAATVDDVHDAYARLALATFVATPRPRAGGEPTLSLSGFAEFARKQPHLVELLLYPARS